MAEKKRGTASTKPAAAKSKAQTKPKRATSKAVLVASSPVSGASRYFVGAWRELREVRWPNRKTTWGLTLAVLLFSGILTLFIVLLDLGFDYITKRILL